MKTDRSMLQTNVVFNSIYGYEEMLDYKCPKMERDFKTL